MSEQRSDQAATHATIEAGELLRGLQSAVDEVFATMLSALGVGTRCGDPRLIDEKRAGGRNAGGSPVRNAIRIEARVDIQGPLQGWICLSCTAEAGDDLVRDLLRMGPGEVLSRAEVEDALGECANMVAGVLKTSMLDSRGRFVISTPRMTSGGEALERPPGVLVYRVCAGTLNAELWLDRRPEMP